MVTGYTTWQLLNGKARWYICAKRIKFKGKDTCKTIIKIIRNCSIMNMLGQSVSTI
jgi:hypothetical protein